MNDLALSFLHFFYTEKWALRLHSGPLDFLGYRLQNRLFFFHFSVVLSLKISMCDTEMCDAQIEPVLLSVFTLALSFEDHVHSCDGPTQKIRLFCSLSGV